MVTLSLPAGMSDVDRFDVMLEWALKVSPEFYFRDDRYGLDSMHDIINQVPHRRLETFCHAVEQKGQISPETLEWLADAGRKYLADETTLEIALGLKAPKRGRPTGKAGAAGLRMFALMHLGNEKYNVALLIVVEESGVSERGIKDAYAKWKGYAEYCGWCKNSK